MCIHFLTADRQSQVLKSIERHIFFQNTEPTTYHCIMDILKKKRKRKIIILSRQSINMQCGLI